MKFGELNRSRDVQFPDTYETAEAEQLVENTLNNYREFKVGYYWEAGNILRIFFAPHEQYAEELTEEFIDEQIDYLLSLVRN